MIKKFRGFFYPEETISQHYHLRKERSTSLFGHLIELRQAARVVKEPSKKKTYFIERIVYIGCIHGGNDNIYAQLTKLAKNPPDYLIFAGDITGSAKLEKLKKQFYDGREKDPNSIYSHYPYFGEWVAILSQEKRRDLLLTIEQSVTRLLSILQKIKKDKTKIYILEGNWDNMAKGGINYLAGSDIKDQIDVAKYFAQNGFQFINSVKTLSTKTTLHIFLPYFTLYEFDKIPQIRLQAIKHQVNSAKKDSKTVIMVGHAEANWKVHHLNKSQTSIQKKRATVIRNFGLAMALFKPDEVIYPHQHARIRDEQGNLIDVNVKYMLQVAQEGVRLVDNPALANGDENQILVTYVPYGFLAESDFINQ